MENMEREIQIATNETFHELVKQQRRTIKMMWKMTLACLIAMVMVVSMTVGGMLYFFSAYAVEVEDTVETTTQTVEGENSSIQNIEGDQYNDNSQNGKGVE